MGRQVGCGVENGGHGGMAMWVGGGEWEGGGSRRLWGPAISRWSENRMGKNKMTENECVRFIHF